MKNKSIAVVFFFLFNLTLSALAGVVAFPEKSYNLGISERYKNGRYEIVEFPVVNSGSTDFEIDKIAASCSCVIVPKDKIVVPAKGAAVIKVELDKYSLVSGRSYSLAFDVGGGKYASCDFVLRLVDSIKVSRKRPITLFKGVNVLQGGEIVLVRDSIDMERKSEGVEAPVVSFAREPGLAGLDISFDVIELNRYTLEVNSVSIERTIFRIVANVKTEEVDSQFTIPVKVTFSDGEEIELPWSFRSSVGVRFGQ